MVTRANDAITCSILSRLRGTCPKSQLRCRAVLQGHVHPRECQAPQKASAERPKAHDLGFRRYGDRKPLNLQLTESPILPAQGPHRPSDVERASLKPQNIQQFSTDLHQLTTLNRHFSNLAKPHSVALRQDARQGSQAFEFRCGSRVPAPLLARIRARWLKSSIAVAVAPRNMDPRLLQEIFLTESDELVSELEQGLVALEDNRADTEAIHRIFRAVHTLKSNAGMLGIENLVRLAHVAENVLSKVRDRHLDIDSNLVTTLLASVDQFRLMIGQVERAEPVDLSPDALKLLSAFERYVAPKTTPEKEPLGAIQLSPLRILRIDMRFADDILLTGQDPSYLIADLADIAEILSVTPNLEGIPDLLALSPETCYITWQIVVQTDKPQSEIDGVFLFVADTSHIKTTDITRSNSRIDELADKRLGELLIEDGAIAQHEVQSALKRQKRLGEVLVDSGAVAPAAIERVLAKQQAARQIRRHTSIRVDTEKLDKLVNLVGELAVAIAHTSHATQTSTSTQAAKRASLEALEQIGRELQSHVMAVRMVPIEELFGRFKRMARDLAQELGKHVVLETFGDETELDKNVCEQLADPLKHMVRNAIAHGLESPDERLKAAKSDTGRVHLRAEQRQGHVIIEVSDDGRGIDLDRVHQKALRLGLISEFDKFTERQLTELLFRPGFSTAAEVSDISGRGVGLDVVKKNISDLHGHVEIESVFGKGTTFRIKLPLTLAIIEGMNVRVGSDTMTIPLSSVVELLSPRYSTVSTFEGKGEVVDVRGEFLPVVRLSQVFELASQAGPQDEPAIVVVENDGRKFGVLVDRVLGMDQTVVKPLHKTFGIVRTLDRHYRKLEAVSGATILGDGNVALILDVTGIERMAFGELQ